MGARRRGPVFGRVRSAASFVGYFYFKIFGFGLPFDFKFFFCVCSGKLEASEEHESFYLNSSQEREYVSVWSLCMKYSYIARQQKGRRRERGRSALKKKNLILSTFFTLNRAQTKFKNVGAFLAYPCLSLLILAYTS